MKKSRVFWVLALVCGFFVGCAEKSAEIPAETMHEIAMDWAEGLQTRDGELRYQHMSEELQKAFVEERKEIYGENWNYVIGWSSPWVTSYEVETEENTAVITYIMEDNSPTVYTMQETIQFGMENGEAVVIASEEAEVVCE